MNIFCKYQALVQQVQFIENNSLFRRELSKMFVYVDLYLMSVDHGFCVTSVFLCRCVDVYLMSVYHDFCVASVFCYVGRCREIISDRSRV